MRHYYADDGIRQIMRNLQIDGLRTRGCIGNCKTF